MSIGTKEKMIGSFLPKILEISNFIVRCNSVAINIVQQLSSLISGKKSIFQSNKSESMESKKENITKCENDNNENLFPLLNTHLHSVFKSLGELLSILATFDQIIDENDFLRESWNLYKVMITVARSDPSSFETSQEEIIDFEMVLVSIDSRLFKGTRTLTHLHTEIYSVV